MRLGKAQPGSVDYGTECVAGRYLRGRFVQYRRGCEGILASLAVVFMSGARLEPMAVERRTGEEQGVDKDAGQREEFHANRLIRRLAMDTLPYLLLINQ